MGGNLLKHLSMNQSKQATIVGRPKIIEVPIKWRKWEFRPCDKYDLIEENAPQGANAYISSKWTEFQGVERSPQKTAVQYFKYDSDQKGDKQ